MKNLWGLFLALILMAGPAFGAGTVACTKTLLVNGLAGGGHIYGEKWVCTAAGDDSDGTLPSYELPAPVHGYVIRAVTDPGTVAPTDNWDFSLTDAEGLDILGGSGADRDTSTSEDFSPQSGATPAPSNGLLNLVITGNTQTAADFEIILFVAY